MPEDPMLTDEVLLLTYSPLLHDIALREIVEVLEMTVTTIDGKSCFLTSIRVDEEHHTLYGRGKEIQTYGEYR